MTTRESTDDPQQTRALRVAAAAARRTGTRERTFVAMVTRRSTDPQAYRRIAYRIERRTVALASAPAPGARARGVQPAPDPSAVDSWAVDPATLPASTEVLCTCLACAGAKKVGCPTCSASGRVRCSTCAGSGRVAGARGPKNCPSCRGQGATKCGACTKGSVTCRACEGDGRVRAWLAVQIQQSVQIRVHPQPALAALHRDLFAPEDLDRGGFRVPLVQDSRWIDALPESLGPELAAELAPRTDRILAIRLQRFAMPVHRFEYATHSAEGHVSVAGDPPAVLPDSVWAPLWGRLAVAVVAGLLTCFVGELVVRGYTGRAAWFAAHGTADAMQLLVVLAGVAAGFAAATGWLPAGARPRRNVAGWTCLAAALALAVAWFVGGPTVVGARESLARGDLAAAQLELDALTRVARAAPELDAAQRELADAAAAEQRRRDVATDQAHLARLQAASSAEDSLIELEMSWKTAELAAEARTWTLQRARAELEPRYQAGEDAALVRLADIVDRHDLAIAAEATARADLLRVVKSRQRADFSGAYAALDAVHAGDDAVMTARVAELRGAIESDLRRRIDATPLDRGTLLEQQQSLAVAVADADLLATRFAAPASHGADALRARLARVEAALAREQQRAAEREQRQRKAAEAAEARRRAAEARAAAQRARLADRVSCCDGTLSPSCRYSQGSLRGCCSHHGGVC